MTLGTLVQTKVETNVNHRLSASCFMHISHIVLHKTKGMENKEAGQQQMFESIDQWQKSGLSQKAFCQWINLSYHIFHYWYKRYRISESKAPTSFVKLGVSSAPVSLHT